jgi:hypothetical protein
MVLAPSVTARMFGRQGGDFELSLGRGLVARGLTNRAIGRELAISEESA